MIFIKEDSSMTLPGKRLRQYHPRRNRKVLSIQKQEFMDCLHTLDLEAGKLIVLCKEGSVDQIQKAQISARGTYLKFKDQLLTLGSTIQQTVKQRAGNYLSSYHTLIESVLAYDEGVFQNYYSCLLKLKAISSLKRQELLKDRDKETQTRSA